MTVPNLQWGIYLDSAAGNLISGNEGNGIHLENANAVRLIGNFIGTDVRGVNPLGNDGDGIRLIGVRHSKIDGGKSGSIVAANSGTE